MAEVLDIAFPGRKMPPDALRQLRGMVADLLQRKNTTFPGAQPVSFCRRHFKELLKEDYYVCEKSDGQRYLLYCTSDPSTGAESTFLIDRRNDYFLVPGCHFPLKESEQQFHTDTLIDGELVLDRTSSGSLRAKFLVFDCLVIDKKSLVGRTLDKRLAYFKDYFFDPYKRLMEKYPQEVEYMPFVVEMKGMQFSYATEMMFAQVLPTLKHGNDGLIFTCRGSPYQYGTDPHILKWKAENENSIDFKLTLDFPRAKGEDGETFIDYHALPTCNLSVGGPDDTDIWYGTLYLTAEEWLHLKSLNEPLQERIVECYVDSQKRWRYMKFRDDKDRGNFHTVVAGVIESIKDRVTKEELCGMAGRIREEWKKRAGQPTGQPPQQGR